MAAPDLPESLSPDWKRRVADLADALAAVPGVQAVVLAGSHARGRARSDSDIDVGLFHSGAAPLNAGTLREVAATWHDGDAAPRVTEVGEWGPWVDGGSWLEIGGTRVDLLYRSFDLLERVWRDAEAGRFEHHWGQQAPFGFFGPTVLGEVLACHVLDDASGRVAEWKQRVSAYPEALRGEVVRALLWQVEFNLSSFLPKFVARADAYGAAGCLTRAAHHLVLVLFALNERYPVNEKTTLDEIDEMPVAPAGFAARTRELLAAVGSDAAALDRSRAFMAQLFEEVAALAGPLYTSPRKPRS